MKAYYYAEQESKKSEEKMKVERIFIPDIFLPLRDVYSITRKMIQSMMMKKFLPSIFLPPTNRKLVMMATYVPCSYLFFYESRGDD